MNICAPWQNSGQFRRKWLYGRIFFLIRQIVCPLEALLPYMTSVLIQFVYASICMSRAGTDSALFDNQRSERPVEITDDAVIWIIDVACQRPADLGYSQELWTLKNLHWHIQTYAQEAGPPGFPQSQSQCSGKSLKGRKSSRSKSNTILKNDTPILKRKCTMY